MHRIQIYFIWYCRVNTSVSFINVLERLSGFHSLFILFPMWNFCHQSVLPLKSFYTWKYVKCFVCFTPLINIPFEIHLQTRPCELYQIIRLHRTIPLQHIHLPPANLPTPTNSLPSQLCFLFSSFKKKSFKTSFCCSNISILWSSTWKWLTYHWLNSEKLLFPLLVVTNCL